MNAYNLESLATVQRQTVYATTWVAALDNTPGDNFLILRAPEGGYMAVSNQNSAFSVPPGHLADTPEAAAASLKNEYALILAVQESKDPTNTKH